MQLNSHKVPFFNKTAELKVGLNQLGLRNASEALFTSLLPGLNNVSNRIRYYSFYCWLIGEFYKNRESFTDKEFYKYIRYSEYLLALIHSRGQGVDGIPGITYALSTRSQGGSNFDLQAGTYNSQGNTKSETYWANAGGVLRQYYSSSLKDIAILKENNEKNSILNISKEDDLVSGSMLADGFAKNVGEDGPKFLKIIQRGNVSAEELNSLESSFNMRKFPQKSNEKELIIELLLQKDYPASESKFSYRKATVYHYLKHFSQNGTKESFTKYMYDEFLNGQSDDDCVLGWYRYYLNDNWQYQTSVIFVALLNQLSNKADWQEVSSVAEELALSIINNIGAKYKDGTLKEICACIDKNDIASKPQRGNLDTEAAPALVNLLMMYNTNKDVRSKRPDYREAFPSAVNSDFYSFMDEIDKSLETNFYEWLKDYILKKIIFCHYQVALRKYLQTGIASQKFIYENGMIRFLNESEATHTGPRTDTLYDFVSDLELVDDKGITDKGILLLNKLEEAEA